MKTCLLFVLIYVFNQVYNDGRRNLVPEDGSISPHFGDKTIKQVLIDFLRKLWHNQYTKKAMMETSRFPYDRQRTREWCEPGRLEKPKILPELQTERRNSAAFAACCLPAKPLVLPQRCCKDY
jgi:hypothetical protein